MKYCVQSKFTSGRDSIKRFPLPTAYDVEKEKNKIRTANDFPVHHFTI